MRHSQTLETQAVGISYSGRPALRAVSATFPPGRVTALIGPSGCGKTSLLNALNRMTDLVGGCVVSGKVLLDGHDIRGPKVDANALRRRVGMLFQRPNPFPLSIRRNISFALREAGERDRQILAQSVEDALKSVGLWHEVKDRLNSSALALSGGQQQRLCLARALALKPEVLLMDEPCSALDPLASGVVEDLILSLRDQYTVLVVTHNLAQARRIADHALFFWHRDGVGDMVEQGPAAGLFEQPQHELTAAYISGDRG